MVVNAGGLVSIKLMHGFYNRTDRREEEKQPSTSRKGGVFFTLDAPIKVCSHRGKYVPSSQRPASETDEQRWRARLDHIGWQGNI